MKNIGLVPFRFGKAASEPLTEKLKAFYVWLAKCVARDDCIISSGNPSLDDITLAMSLNEYEQEPEIAYYKLLNRIKSWGATVDIGIIDMANTPDDFIPGPMELHLATAISNIFSSKIDATLDICVVLLSRLPPKDELVVRTLQPNIDNGEIIIIDDLGKVRAKRNLLRNFDSKQYQIQLKNANENPIDLLELKMIRRLGHFQRKSPEGKITCLRAFYDGSECESELVQLVDEHIKEQYKDITPLLLYYSEISEWLKRPVMALAKRIGGRYASVEDFLANHTRYNTADGISPLILFPVYVTGATLESILLRWKKIPKIKPPTILAILSAAGEEERFGTIKLKVEEYEYTIPYLLKVRRPAYEHRINCPMCALGLSESNKRYEDYAMLTTYDMWDMAEEAGWKPEPKDEITIDRLGLESVPNFYEMIHKNGAWLARKIKDRISFDLVEYPAMPILVICPNERGANALADHLSVNQGINVIRIPKKVINTCVKMGEVPLNYEEKWRREEWYKQLSSSSKNHPVVILEKFTVTGSSKTALYELANFYEFNVLCHFTLLDFNPEARDSAPLSYSLYECQIFTEQYKKEC